MQWSLYSPYGLLGEVRDTLTIALDTLCQEVGMLAKEGELGGERSAHNKFAGCNTFFYIYFRMDMQWSLYSPFGLLGVMRDSLTLAWDTLCQEVVMLAKEGELGGAFSAQNKFERTCTFFSLYIRVDIY